MRTIAFKVTLTAAIELRDTDTDEVIMSSNEVLGTTTYLTPGQVTANTPRGTVGYSLDASWTFASLNENVAGAEVIEDLANNIYILVVEGWGL